jgi:tetratricopeptide (TPR) repeat protein
MRRATVAAVGLLLAACATTAAPPPTATSARHRDRAHALERDGQLHAAVLEWKIVRALEPQDAAAATEQTRLEARIERRINEQLSEARASLARGAHLEARRRLLSVLALDPSNAAAAALLRGSVREVDFVLHTVRAGDTLSSLADRYYGDRTRGEVIWETNRLTPGRPLVAGSTLKIPEIPGLPLIAAGRKAPAPSAASAASAPPAPSAASPAPSPPAVAMAPTPGRATPDRPEEPPEVNPMLADVRDALERKDYASAVADADRYLAQNPGDREGLELKRFALYRHGQTLIEQKSYDEGYKALSQLARMSPDYQDIGTLVQQARRQAIDYHYQEGIRHFREERLEEAIAEWRIVIDMDPMHPNAQRNVEQAERLLQALERRRAR